MSDQDAQRWHDRAQEVLMRAIKMHDEQLRWEMLQLAVCYDHLAKRAENGVDPGAADSRVRTPTEPRLTAA
jgi:hypothetical protein